jgi:hypothetical protein
MRGSAGEYSAGGLHSIIDDLEEAKTSNAKLRSLKITTVFPCHGRPFPFDKVPEMQLSRIGASKFGISQIEWKAWLLLLGAA